MTFMFPIVQGKNMNRVRQRRYRWRVVIDTHTKVILLDNKTSTYPSFQPSDGHQCHFSTISRAFCLPDTLPYSRIMGRPGGRIGPGASL